MVPGMGSEKLHIEKNTVQETLVLPLYGRKVCSERFPQIFHDEEADRLVQSLDYDFSEYGKSLASSTGLLGALEVAQRQNDVAFEIRDYLAGHERAAVVNMGCGLDGSFRRCDNGTARGYNVDMPDVIQVRDRLLGEGERERNIASDLNDFSWMDQVDGGEGAIFFAMGVLCYFSVQQVRALLAEIARRFPGSVVVFDAFNRRGARMFAKTWQKETGIGGVGIGFCLDDPAELAQWGPEFGHVSSRSYMRGYQDICPELGLVLRVMVKACDRGMGMRIVKVQL